MHECRWWKRAAWISAGMAVILASFALGTAWESGGEVGILLGAAIVGLNAGIWIVTAAGLAKRQRWAVHLGTGVALLNLVQGVAAGLMTPAAAALALHERGLDALAHEGSETTPLTSVLGWAPAIGSAMLLVSLILLHRQSRREAPSLSNRGRGRRPDPLAG